MITLTQARQIYFKNQQPIPGGPPHPVHLPLSRVIALVTDSFTSATERHIEVSAHSSVQIKISSFFICGRFRMHFIPTFNQDCTRRTRVAHPSLFSCVLGSLLLFTSISMTILNPALTCARASTLIDPTTFLPDFPRGSTVSFPPFNPLLQRSAVASYLCGCYHVACILILLVFTSHHFHLFVSLSDHNFLSELLYFFPPFDGPMCCEVYESFADRVFPDIFRCSSITPRPFVSNVTDRLLSRTDGLYGRPSNEPFFRCWSWLWDTLLFR